MTQSQQDEEFAKLFQDAELKQIMEKRRQELRAAPASFDVIKTCVIKSIYNTLQHRNDYILIGGRALMQYIDYEKFKKYIGKHNDSHMKDVILTYIESVDFDLITYNRMLFREIVSDIKVNCSSMLEHIVDKIYNIGQIDIHALVYKNRENYVDLLNVHYEPTLPISITIDRISVARLSYLYEENIKHMFTELESKNMKRKLRNQLVITPVKEGNKEFLRDDVVSLIDRSCDKSDIETITGFSINCDQLSDQ